MLAGTLGTDCELGKDYRVGHRCKLIGCDAPYTVFPIDAHTSTNGGQTMQLPFDFEKPGHVDTAVATMTCGPDGEWITKDVCYSRAVRSVGSSGANTYQLINSSGGSSTTHRATCGQFGGDKAGCEKRKTECYFGEGDFTFFSR